MLRAFREENEYWDSAVEQGRALIKAMSRDSSLYRQWPPRSSSRPCEEPRYWRPVKSNALHGDRGALIRKVPAAKEKHGTPLDVLAQNAECVS